MPTYLIGRGIAEGNAYAASSMFSIVGMVGSVVGGILATKIWRRKLVMTVAMAKNPMMISGAFAMANGTGMLMTLIVSPAFTAMTAAAGMDMAYRVFFAVCILGLLAVMSAKESGRKPE